ncbi:hypothetical protein OYT88_04545 [Sporolactobacillus sp. CQH2019]|uniref:hypothetical protein n=1 Tax=Sporolactobacillus sp. CQH2019 TaxID=3023512 RepID=UPI002368E034|nr:hypothetical protein [Sporolactobacillus sp. CQH2019]MDD9147818.1 hypothetical protein [Sporolactobacillus sp. CQH2019]
MEKVEYDLNLQIGILSVKIANLEVENSKLQAINQALGAKLDKPEVENKKLADGQVKNVKADKPKESVK